MRGPPITPRDEPRTGRPWPSGYAGAIPRQASAYHSGRSRPSFEAKPKHGGIELNCGDLAHPHVEPGCLYAVPAEWPLPALPMAIGTAPDSPPGASPCARAPGLPDRAPFFVAAMAAFDVIAPILSSFSRIIFVCERPVIPSVQCKTGNGAATRGD